MGSDRLATNGKRVPQRLLVLGSLLALGVVLLIGCGSGEQRSTSGSASSDRSYPKGSDWQMSFRENDWLRNPPWGDYVFFDVICSVTLLRDTTYSDSHLVSIARKVVQYITESEKVTRVGVDFWPPENIPGAQYGRITIAEVVWAAQGDFDPMGRHPGEIGNYSEHRYRVTYNYARTQRASKANNLGL